MLLAALCRCGKINGEKSKLAMKKMKEIVKQGEFCYSFWQDLHFLSIKMCFPARSEFFESFNGGFVSELRRVSRKNMAAAVCWCVAVVT